MMKYILALISAFAVILAVILIQKQSEDKNSAVSKTEKTSDIAELVSKLKPLVDEVSLKHFQNDEAVYNNYKNHLMMIDMLSEQIILQILRHLKNIILKITMPFVLVPKWICFHHFLQQVFMKNRII